ncbi:MAG: SDR family NAD(P)-dependent oxidoreductase, partial [Gemmatimonadales bacterium]|nr:SDR family NAD(P)-dependent oxidoreductase [Gemmatimonadales bacterium]
MKVFVTGATGFIGRALSERLIDEGHAVKALARESASISSLEHLDLEIVPGDIRDADVVEKAMDGCEHVYHLAAATSWSRTRPEYAAVNVEGTRNVARAAWKAGVRRLVYASTVGVYGSLTSPPIDESTPPRPDSRYRETKLAGEEVVLSWQRKERLPVVIARLATT